MFGFLQRMFRIKTKELEAKLYPTQDCTFGGVGEIEVSLFSDGQVKVELSLKHSGIPNNATLEFVGGGTVIGTASPQGGFLKKYEDLTGSTLWVDQGSSAELRVDGVVLYRGEFRPD